MKRSPIRKRAAKKKRTTSPRCSTLRCNKRAEIAGLCVSHAEQKADTEFSLFIRARDGRCTAEGVLLGECVGGLQAAHIVGRRNKAVRFDEANVHALCMRHHMTVDQAGQEHAKYLWAVEVLGVEGYVALMDRAAVRGERREAIRSWLEVS